MTRPLLLFCIATVVLLGACSDSTVAPIPPTVDEPAYSISGKLRFQNDTVLPSNARLLVAWVVSSGSPDYVYIYGEGTINRADSTYRIDFEDSLPAEAINSYGMGVGVVIVTTNQSLTFRRYSDVESSNMLDSAFYGGSENHGVIYVRDSLAQTRVKWLAPYDIGYNAGRGVRMTQGFDQFEKVAPNTIEVVIDELDNLEFVNWT